MGQQKNAPRVKENEARAFGRMIRTGTRKLNTVAGLIRGKTAERALVDLEFCERRVAKEVRDVLHSAISNAENNFGLDPDSLIVAEASVGKAIRMKRFRARARGRASRIEKDFSNLTIVLRESA